MATGRPDADTPPDAVGHPRSGLRYRIDDVPVLPPNVSDRTPPHRLPGTAFPGVSPSPLPFPDRVSVAKVGVSRCVNGSLSYK